MEGAEGLSESDGEGEKEEDDQPTTSDMDDEERVAKESTFEHEHRGTAYLNQVGKVCHVSRASDVSRAEPDEFAGFSSE